jgi:hypothetical protein
MKKKLLSALALGMSLLLANAQEKEEVQDAFDRAFSQINKSEITTKFLYDQTWHTSRLHRFDGTRDTVLGANDWKQICFELYSMRTDPNSTPFTKMDTLFKKAMDYYLQGVNPLVLFNVDYHQIKAGAFSQHLLDTANGYVRDVAGFFPAFSIGFL